MEKQPVDLAVVLVHPQIPPNTGQIARLCACNAIPLHLIRPLGFSLAESRLKRAGLDYWERVSMQAHDSWEHFLEGEGVQTKEMVGFSARARRPFWDQSFLGKRYLLFGSETKGLPEALHQNPDLDMVTIPQLEPSARCLNLASAASIGVYEVLRQKREQS
ncbi:MAG: tRNA (cytidine(34)-2'-O)-methyltransferase [Okeania sp. SIO1H5]|nr:tRNA (cytidine(34)-2'-O)-methyltransferase [Okeania sp. SIO1H5]